MLIEGGRIYETTHNLPSQWLGARMVAWMFDEAQGAMWWLCALTCDGVYRYASHNNMHQPPEDMQQYARNVCRYINKVANHGGAWFTAWFDDRRFYLLWKDRDGDIQIPIECDLGWESIKDWKAEDWAEQAEQAHAQWMDFHSKIEYGAGQQVCLAQGEKLRPY